MDLYYPQFKHTQNWHHTHTAFSFTYSPPMCVMKGHHEAADPAEVQASCCVFNILILAEVAT